MPETRLHVEWKCELGYEKCDQCNYDTHTELFSCKVCGGTESCLPTECPGKELTNEEAEAIMKNKLNFKNNRWVTV